MARESMKAKRERAIAIAELLQERYPDPDTELIYDNDPFHLVVAVLLSAQTTDKAVNKVTPILWARYPTLESLASAQLEEVEDILRPIGFFRTKAKNTIGCAQMVLSDFGGEVPRSIDELQKLPGVGRKTANIVTNVAFGDVVGIAVDTHVYRIVHLLKLTNAESVEDTERDLLKLLPQELWGPINHQLVLYGREVCIARRPKCLECTLAPHCPSAGKPQVKPIKAKK